MPRPKTFPSLTHRLATSQQPAPNKNDPTASDAVMFSNWPPDECQKLVDFIKERGFDGDMKKLCKQFPGHTETNIRHFMSELAGRTIGEETPLGKLAKEHMRLQEMARVNNMSQSHASVLPLFVDWMAFFVDYPEPAEVGDVDYAEIFHSLAAIMRGEIPRALPSRTASKFVNIVEEYFARLKYYEQIIPLSTWFKKPVKSAEKSQKDRNATLASRRSLKWTPGEIVKSECLLSFDLPMVRQIYLTSAWANPYRYPDEQSLFRYLKTMPKKIKKEECHDYQLIKDESLSQTPSYPLCSENKQIKLEVYDYLHPIVKLEPICIEGAGNKIVKQEEEQTQPKKVIRRRRRRRN